MRKEYMLETGKDIIERRVTEFETVRDTKKELGYGSNEWDKLHHEYEILLNRASELIDFSIQVGLISIDEWKVYFHRLFD